MSDDPIYPRMQAVLKANRDALLQRRDINFVCIGCKTINGQRTDQLAIIFAVNEKNPEEELEEEELLPKFLQGCPTDVVEQEVVDPFKNCPPNNKNI